MSAVQDKMDTLARVIQGLPSHERLSIPLAGRTLLSSTRSWAEPLLEAHQQLVHFLQSDVDLDSCRASYKANYSFLNYSVDHHPKSDVILLLCSAGLILNWLVGRVVGALDSDSSLAEAEEWFRGKNDSPLSLTAKIPIEIQRSVVESLKSLDYGPHFVDILPYAAEVFETSNEILVAFGATRKSKRAAGIFYTPSDVSDFIVDALLSNSNNESRDFTWLDPACGTGCFLLSVLYRVSRTKSFTPGERALESVRTSLYGVDVSPLALQSAAYLLVLVSMQDQLLVAGSLKRSLFRIGKNLAVCDATTISGTAELCELFPELTAGVDFVISNPPYIAHSTSKVIQSKLFSDTKIPNKDGGNIYLTFIRMMPSLSKRTLGGGGMVVPLSISYNTREEFHQLRQFMWASGEWQLIHFDRTPDSLFGDDVKTRNTIVFFANKPEKRHAISTSDLIRWSSRSRTQLFEKTSTSRVSARFSSTPIPKVGQPLGREMLETIEQRRLNPLGQCVTRVDHPNIQGGSVLRSAVTAYNWLPFEMVTNELLSTGGARSLKYRYWSVRTEDKAVIFALVQSRLAYWLWRVWGDGFHLTDRFIVSMPFSPNSLSIIARDSLRNFGEELWKEMLTNKVTSLNAGIPSISYCPYVSENILDAIDQTLIREYELPGQAAKYLKDFIERTIVAGRDNEIHKNPALRKWMTREGTK